MPPLAKLAAAIPLSRGGPPETYLALLIQNLLRILVTDKCSLNSWLLSAGLCTKLGDGRPLWLKRMFARA